MFDPQDIFLPKEILPPPKQAYILSLSSTDLSVQPQAFKIVENYHGAPDTNPEPRETPAARKCTYKEFMSCQPFYFNGTKEAVGLIHWFERTELVFPCSNCTEDCKVKFSIGNFTEDALSWWNSYAKLIGIEQANKIAWSELKRLLTNKYSLELKSRK
uniref:Reverse transcriptase domain-containing protein n=1 Tax=Tanacetum cinerariifolium TaxID=118510 RepID=A0A6L2KTX1_TANCI|nr:reverse transcriptase domain-containing protein [Tanacetum cinerariifolium]